MYVQRIESDYRNMPHAYKMLWPQYWKRNTPDVLESDRVKIQGQNFFDPQLTRHDDDNLETSLSSSLAKYSTTGQTSIASRY